MIFSNENAKFGGDRMTSDFMKELLSKDEKNNSRVQNLSVWHSGRCV